MTQSPGKTNLRLTGDWQLAVSTSTAVETQITVAPPTVATRDRETLPRLPEFNPKASPWARGVPLPAVKAQECAVTGALDPASLVLQPAPAYTTSNAAAVEATVPYVLGTDYQLDPFWGTVGRIAGGRIPADTPVLASYRATQMRLDSIVQRADGAIVLVPGTPDAAVPQPPAIGVDDIRLCNIYLNGWMPRLSPDSLLPVLEATCPRVRNLTPPPPRALAKLRSGLPLKILAWGDSVTDGGYLPGKPDDRWQEQFVARLRAHFPKSEITLVTEAWGGRNTNSYFAEPPGSVHNYEEKVLAVKPDLVISEFVNDAGLDAAGVERNYGRILNDFRLMDAEWIILTPHYVRPDWMGLKTQVDIDHDPRPYVAAIRAFAVANDVALADAAIRWGRLWRQGIPYLTMLHNNINHPDRRGMKLFGDALMALFTDPLLPLL